MEIKVVEDALQLNRYLAYSKMFCTNYPDLVEIVNTVFGEHEVFFAGLYAEGLCAAWQPVQSHGGQRGEFCLAPNV